MAKKNNEVLDVADTDAIAPETEAAEVADEAAAETPEEPVAEQPSAPTEPPAVSGAVSTIEDDFDDEPLDGAAIAKARSTARRRGLFIVAFIVVVVAVGVFFALQSGMLQGACAGLEPGIHKLDNGTKVSCS